MTKSLYAMTIAAVVIGAAPGSISAKTPGFGSVAMAMCPGGQKAVCYRSGGKLVCTCDGPIRT